MNELSRVIGELITRALSVTTAGTWASFCRVGLGLGHWVIACPARRQSGGSGALWCGDPVPVWYSPPLNNGL